MAIETTYRPLITVTSGIMAQIEANLNALESAMKELKVSPDEAEKLGETLADAHAICETIIGKGEKEPDTTK